jgi:hypothetical protein
MSAPHSHLEFVRAVSPEKHDDGYDGAQWSDRHHNQRYGHLEYLHRERCCVRIFNVSKPEMTLTTFDIR